MGQPESPEPQSGGHPLPWEDEGVPGLPPLPCTPVLVGPGMWADRPLGPLPPGAASGEGKLVFLLNPLGAADPAAPDGSSGLRSMAQWLALRLRPLPLALVWVLHATQPPALGRPPSLKLLLL